jgi:hypothetical protein
MITLKRMSNKVRLLISVFLFLTYGLFGQTINFNYDLNGNRISRVLISGQLKSETINFPVEEPDKLAIEENQNETVPDGETSIKIYPNPTKGILKIEIINFPTEAKTALKLFDLSGLELISINNLSPAYELNLNNYKDGIYILRILINNAVTNWKIIKCEI